MLIKITNGSVSFGADTVLECVNFDIKEREKVAIVGRNGCGKSTLLKCLTGELEMEEGTGEEPFSIAKTGKINVGHLKQIAFSSEENTLLQEVLEVFQPILSVEEKMHLILQEIEKNSDEKKVKEYSALVDKYEFMGGYTYKKEYSTMIKKFGFSEEDKLKRIAEFSGGQRTKIAFMKLLLSHPDLLLLDEPTNHLDVGAVKWLENYIRSYKSAVVIVSHDRMFIERTVDKVYEIEYGETRCYHGKYSDFERQKRVNYQQQLKSHEYQQEEIKRLMRLVERFRYKATKARMVQSKLKQIERMKIIDKPDRYDLKTFHANFQPRVETVSKVLFLQDLEVGYDFPLAKINLELKRGEKLGIIGDNGIGKSTLLKTLVREIPALSGRFEFGLRSEIGYFNQQMAQYKSGKTVFDDFHDEFPLLNETEVRTALGSFLFSGEDVFKCVDDLSGGERVRLALCKMFKKRPNVLILDEPTNHMDIVGKETLENMLIGYEGTVIFVSHDRYFISKVANKILSFSGGEANFYPFGFEEFELLEKEREEKQEVVEKPQNKTGQAGAKKNFSTPLKDKGKKERRVQKLEELLKTAEKTIAELNAELESPEIYSDYLKVSKIQEELDRVQAEANAYSEEWFTLSSELEELNG